MADRKPDVVQRRGITTARTPSTADDDPMILVYPPDHLVPIEDLVPVLKLTESRAINLMAQLAWHLGYEVTRG